jgi:hypothetical protein
VHRGRVDPQADRWADSEDGEQLVVERDRGPRRQHDEGAEEPSAEAEDERVHRPQRRDALAPEAAEHMQPSRRKIGSAGWSDLARMRFTGSAISRDPASERFSGTTSVPQSAR